MLKTGVLWLLSWMVLGCSSARILAIVPLPVRSHWIIMEPLFKELALRGHNVTVFSSFPQRLPLANYTDVDFSPKLTPHSGWNLNMIKEKMANTFQTMSFINQIHTETCKIMESDSLKSLLSAKGQYDVLITEIFGNDCFAYFAYKLGIPLISVMTSPGSSWLADRTGMPDNPSYIPHVFFVPEHDRMTIFERIYNTVLVNYARIFYRFYISKQTQDLAEKAFGERLPPITDVICNTSLVLVNSHHSLPVCRPLPPNVVEIAGIHIKERQQLPKVNRRRL